jgi:hypothetical protein
MKLKLEYNFHDSCKLHLNTPRHFWNWGHFVWAIYRQSTLTICHIRCLSLYVTYASFSSTRKAFWKLKHENNFSVYICKLYCWLWEHTYNKLTIEQHRCVVHFLDGTDQDEEMPTSLCIKNNIQLSKRHTHINCTEVISKQSSECIYLEFSKLYLLVPVFTVNFLQSSAASS